MESWYCEGCSETHHEGQTCSSKSSSVEQRVIMPRTMVFIDGDGPFEPKEVHRMCAHFECESTIEEPIIHYTSRQHAKDSGWLYVERGPFCKKGNNGVWVCPLCAQTHHNGRNKLGR